MLLVLLLICNIYMHLLKNIYLYVGRDMYPPRHSSFLSKTSPAFPVVLLLLNVALSIQLQSVTSLQIILGQNWPRTRLGRERCHVV